MLVLRSTARDQVRRVLTERILTGHYAAGTRLVELQIARELGTSQGPVREALRELEASRLVESIPRRGTRVRSVSPQELREVYLVRGILEEAAANAVGDALAGQVGPLRDEVVALLAVADSEKFAEQAAHVYNIHRTIVAASGNATLLRVWESLSLETRVRIRLGLGAIDRAWLTGSYNGILTALDSGNGCVAGQLLKKHAEMLAPEV